MTEAHRALTTRDVLEVAFPPLSQGAPLDLAVHTVPQRGEPRWIVLGEVRKALPVLQSWQPWNLSSRIRWGAVLAAASTGMLAHLPGVTRGGAQLDLSYWRQAELPTWRGSLVIHVGTRSHTRKAILFFVEDEQIRFAARVPLVEGAAGAILNEAAMLRVLEGNEFLPHNLFVDPKRGIAAQSWLAGRPVARGLSAAHLDLLARLVRPGSVVRVCNFAPQIASAIDSLCGPFDPDVLRAALDVLNCDEPLPSFIEHRDFAPWNLKWLATGVLGLLDWEWSILDGLPWQDICRFFYIEDAHFHGSGAVWEQLTANSLLRTYCERFAIPQRALPALTMHYLLRVLAMDWSSGNEFLAQHSYKQIQRLLHAVGNYRPANSSL